MNREAWLCALVDRLRPHFVLAGAPLPPTIYVSVGFPSPGGCARDGTIGEAWTFKHKKRSPQIFISPILCHPLMVAGVLVHELIHAAIGSEQGHGKAFRRVAEKIGLTGRMTATEVTPSLRRLLRDMIKDLGPYNHQKLELDEKKKPSTRRSPWPPKIHCPACSFWARVPMGWPGMSCPSCNSEMHR